MRIPGRGQSPKIEKPQENQLLRALSWRKERDSNPRYAKKRIPDFESGAFDHSAIFPGVEFVILPEPDPGLTGRTSGFEHLKPAHVGLERLGDAHTAIGLLVVFQHCHQGAANRQARAIECVHKLVLALRILEAGL